MTSKYVALWVVDGVRHFVPARKRMTHDSIKAAERALDRLGRHYPKDTRGLIFNAGANTDIEEPVLTIAL